MRLLLDTNTFLWQIGLAKQSKIGVQTKQLMQAADAVCVCSISLVELHIKAMLGKLRAPADCQNEVVRAGDKLLAFSPEAADCLPAFPSLTRHDPFDRMLLAQAQADGLTFVTADETLLGLGLSFVVDSRA